MDASKRRLSIVLYRNMLRWCQEVDPNVSLRAYHPTIANSVELELLLKKEFREKCGPTELKSRQSKAMEAMRRMNEIKQEVLSMVTDDDQQQPIQEAAAEQDVSLGSLEYISSVDWLPSIQEMVSMHATESLHDSQADETTIYPMFPLGGRLYDPNEPVLPLFSPVSDIAAPGMEIPLKIFEPRYRQLYNDLLQSPNRRRVVVPFPHPTESNRYATHGLLWEVVSLQEVADETNGVVQYLTNHLVTKPVRIERVMNPQQWETQEAYLKAECTIVEDWQDSDSNTVGFESLEEELQEWVDQQQQQQGGSHLVSKVAINALRMDGIWGLVKVWNSHLQQELLRRQVKVGAEIKIQQCKTAAEVETVQLPHRARLLQLMLDRSLLVPALLQRRDDTERFQYMLQLVKKERER